MFSAEQLLSPISQEQPAGASLAFSPELDAIAHARTFDDPSLDQGEWITTLKEADWEFVVSRCSSLLESRSKDLRLAVWLTEAAAKRHHLPGLAEGLLVLAGLLERFWDQGLFPEAEDGDHEQRIGNLSWILARLPALLREIPITDGNGSAWSKLDFDCARQQSGDARRLAEMEAARRVSSSAFRSAFAAQAQACVEALAQLERAADQRLGNDAPGFVNARDALDDLMHLVRAPIAIAPVPQSADGATEENGPASTVSAVPGSRYGSINARSQAITQLRAIAEFFRRTEPHSPVSYFADKAASAGQQDLHTWLRSVMKDPASLAHIEEMLGVKDSDQR